MTTPNPVQPAPDGWRSHPAFFLTCITPLLHEGTRTSMPRTETGLIIAIDDDVTAVHLEAAPTGADAWTVNVWAAVADQDRSTTALALAVARAGNAPDLSTTVTRVDIEAEDDELDTPSPAGYQRALWRVLRRQMTHARAIADTAGLRSRIPDLHVASLGGSYPFQADGTWCGYPFYFRFRYGTARLDIGRTPDMRTPLWSAEMPFEGLWGDSDLSIEEFTDLFCTLGSQLDRAPFVYEFTETTPAMTFPDPSGTAHAKPWQGSGHSPAEGYAELVARVSQAQQTGFDVNPQFDPTPVNTDRRVFPETTPTFTVHPPTQNDV